MQVAALCEEVELSLRAGETRDLAADAAAVTSAVRAALDAFTALGD